MSVAASVHQLRTIDTALGVIISQQEVISKLESALTDEYIGTFKPGNDHNRAIRRVLERIMWLFDEEREVTREQWLENLRTSARELYELKVKMDRAKETGEGCDGTQMGCVLPDPAECPVHSVIYKRMQAAFNAYKKHGTPPVPEPERAQTPGDGDGIVIPITGSVAAALGLVTVPDGSGGAVFIRRRS